MRMERKKTKYGDAFWVLRFCDAEEKEEYIKQFNVLINGTIKEEERSEYSHILDVFGKAEHNAKYDEENNESVIIHSSQITSLLCDLFFLCFVASFTCEYNRALKSYCETVDKHKETVIGIEERIIDFSKNIMKTDIPISRYGISCASTAILTGKEHMIETLTTAKLNLPDETDERNEAYNIAIEVVNRLLEPAKKETGDAD